MRRRERDKGGGVYCRCRKEKRGEGPLSPGAVVTGIRAGSVPGYFVLATRQGVQSPAVQEAISGRVSPPTHFSNQFRGLAEREESSWSLPERSNHISLLSRCILENQHLQK